MPGKMLILAVDTSTSAGSLALLEDGQVLATRASIGQDPYSSRLFRDLQILLIESAAELSGIDLFAVAAGPGSFTGLRVGLAAVKGWAEVYQKPVVAVSTLEAVAEQVEGDATAIVPVLDAHRNQVFAGVYEKRDGTLRQITDDVVMSAEEFLDWLAQQQLPARPVFVSTAPECIEAALRRSSFAGCELQKASPLLAPAVGRIASARAQRGEVSDAMSLDAHYVRRSDAELLWKVR